jgi:hypothetical protein
VQLNGAVHKQDFDFPALVKAPGASSQNMPIGFAFVESGTGSNITYTADDGGLSVANSYSYGADNNDDRALGELSGAIDTTLGACFVNNTGFVIPAFTISYTGEQWRLGADDGNTDRLDFQFSTDATSLTTGTYTDVNSLDFMSPTNTGSAGARDGNAAANRTSKGPVAIIPPSPIPSGATFFIRWLPADITGNDDGLAIDDFQITYSPSADFDQDQDIDGKDFLSLQRGLTKKSGASISDGDANKDTAVDLLDRVLWTIQFGTTADAPPQFAAVPEPSGSTLAAYFVAALLAERLVIGNRLALAAVTRSCRYVGGGVRMSPPRS